METRQVRGSIVDAMAEAVNWAKSLGARKPQYDNDNDSGEVYFKSKGVNRVIKVRWSGPEDNDFKLTFTEA